MTIQSVTTFVGREALLDDYKGFLRVVSRSNGPARVYYGQSGIGKTHLRAKMASLAKEQGFAVAEWDLRHPHVARPERVLAAWHALLQLKGGGFSTVYDEYQRQFEAGAELPRRSEDLIATPLVKSGIDVAKNTPWVGWFVSGAEFVNTTLRSWRRKQVKKERNLDDRIAAAQSHEQFVALLVDEFLFDLHRWSRDESRYIALYLDRFDTFGASDPGAEYVPMPGWLQLLIDQSARIAVTMFSQRRIATTGDRVEMIPVPLFTAGESEDYLDEAKVEDPKIRAAMKTFAGGLPFGLAAAVDTARAHRGTVTPELFKLEGTLAEKIYSTLAESPALRQDVLNVLAVPRAFDRPMALSVFKELRLPFKKKDFDAFIANRFVERDQNGVYSIHTLLRNAANAHLRDNDRSHFQKVHKLLFDEYRGRVTIDVLDDADFRFIGEALYHGAWSGGEDDFALWLHEIDRMARYAGRQPWLEENYIAALRVPDLSEVARAQLQLVLGGLYVKTDGRDPDGLVEKGFLAMGQIRPGTVLYAWALLDRGELAKEENAPEKALELARQSLELFQKLPGPNHIGEALATNNVAFYEGALGNDVARIKGYKRAMNLGDQHQLPDVDLYKNNYAQAIAAAGELDDALALHRENADLRQRKGRIAGVGATRSHIAQILALKGDLQAALEESGAALEIHRKTRRMQRILAAERLQVDIHLQLGEVDEARSLAQKVLENSRKVSNVDQVVESLYWWARVHIESDPAVAMKAVLEGLALLDAKGKRRFKAELLAVRACLEAKKDVATAVTTYRDALQVHFNTVHTRCYVLSDYATALTAAGLHDEAYAALLQAVAISEIIGLSRHADREAAMQRARRLAKPAARWERPDERILAIDKEFDKLLKSVSLSEYEKVTNRDHERTRVFSALKARKTHNPQFIYKQMPPLPVGFWLRLLARLDLSKVLDRLYNELIYEQLRAMHRVRTHDPKAITDSTADAYGWPDQDLLNIASRIISAKPPTLANEARVDAAEAKRRVEKRLADMGVAERWKAVIDENLTPRLLANTTTNTINIRASLSISPAELDALVLHEVDAHVSRAENGREQMLSIFSTGLPGYLVTEEGLAVYAEVTASGGQIPARIALRVLAAEDARKLGFFDVFANCVAMIDDQDQDVCFDIVARLKRGFNDTSKPGANLKDTVYLRGLLAMRDLLKNDQAEKLWRDLFVGKVAIEHLPAVAAALEDGWLKPGQLMFPLPERPISIPISGTDYGD